MSFNSIYNVDRPLGMQWVSTSFTRLGINDMTMITIKIIKIIICL